MVDNMTVGDAQRNTPLCNTIFHQSSPMRQRTEILINVVSSDHLRHRHGSFSNYKTTLGSTINIVHDNYQDVKHFAKYLCHSDSLADPLENKLNQKKYLFSV